MSEEVESKPLDFMSAIESLTAELVAERAARIAAEAERDRVFNALAGVMAWIQPPCSKCIGATADAGKRNQEMCDQAFRAASQCFPEVYVGPVT
jgi:hypothetical protein